jgi:hypothetical protein
MFPLAVGQKLEVFLRLDALLLLGFLVGFSIAVFTTGKIAMESPNSWVRIEAGVDAIFPTPGESLRNGLFWWSLSTTALRWG